jgi:hypothetical protein
MTISQKQFFSNPEAAILAGSEVPAEWIQRAWEQHERFREDVVYYLARSVSKTGTFNLADAAWLKVLPDVLSAEDAAALYLDILEQSQRLEYEWRPAFLAAFPAAAPLLPEPADVAILRATLEQQIESGFGAGFEELVQSLTSLPGGQSALTQPNDAGETLLATAERLGRETMASILREQLTRAM